MKVIAAPTRPSAFIYMLMSILVFLSASCSDGEEVIPDGDSSETPSSQCECREDADCDPGYFCSSHCTCLDQCRSNADCKDGFCDPESGQCLECLEDDDCSSLGGQAYCDMDYNLCRIGCNDCHADQECIDNRCQRTEPDGDMDAELQEEEAELDAPWAKCPPAPYGLNCDPLCVECVTDTISRMCREDGSGFDQTLCDEGDYCNRVLGICESPVCTWGERMCEGNTARLCNEDGTGWIDTICSNEEQCIDGYCQNIICSEPFGAVLFTFEVHSKIAAPDRYCSREMNIGYAEWETITGRGEVVSFDGEESRIMLPSTIADSREGLTISLDVFLSGEFDGNEVLLSKGDPAAIRLSIENERPTFHLMIEGVDQYLQGDPISRGVWRNITATFNGIEMRLYLDGEIQGSPATFPGQREITQNANSISVGALSATDGAASEFLNGKLDNLYFASEGISASEVSYFADNILPCPPEEGEEDSLYCTNLCSIETLAVSSAQAWTPTEANFFEGEAVYLNPGGCVHPRSDSECIPADGGGGGVCSTCPIPSLPRYVLIARFGDEGEPFFLSEEKMYIADKQGLLQIGYNDDDFMRNQGGFSVIMTRGYCNMEECPPGTVWIPDTEVCIDRYEASCSSSTATISSCNVYSGDTPISMPSRYPWTNISAEDAVLACQTANKRLCTQDEWVKACGGFGNTIYPYGGSHEEDTCNDSSYAPPVPYLGFTSGGFLYKCSSDTGAMDLSGNAAEYVTNDDGYRAMSGRDITNGSTCYDNLTIEESSDLIGFRCCYDLP